MKLKFDSNLKYQNDAVSAVVNLFEGQNSMLSYFTVTGQLSLDSTVQGVANKLDISPDEDILNNLRDIQSKNQLPPSENLSSSTMDFNIEMETGTGKTYVYLKTIFELNKKYGFTKFIIVVPSLAIKEGVYKSINITKNHFKGLYDNVIYDSFIYDSQKLEQVRNFAVNSNIQIMVINIDAFRRSFTDPSKETSANIIHRPNDKLNGWKPIELIQETNPIVIIDEPQSVANTPKAKEAIESLNPLCTLRYSATHSEIQNLIYRLDAINAYEMNLVKQIEVASFESLDYHNKAYMKLISVDNKKSPITAKIEIDQYKNGNVKRKVCTVKQGDDLTSTKLGNRDIYEGYTVNEIYCGEGNEYVDFTNREETLTIGKVVGDIDDFVVKRQQIRKTIEEHLDKELILTKKGIKVLSLFFIDKVANYRTYDEEGNPQKGPYALMFEEEYNKLSQKQKFSALKDVDIETPVEKIHNGYFSIDKSGKNKGKFKDTKGNTLADDDTYSLIMKDKERLLSFDSPLRFIFSHSALKEGWDNPNVFQICTLNETKSTMKKRQEIGRGLRLCVNQEGDRVHNNDINILTVMANESYEDFAKTLQKEMEQEAGIKFGIIEKYTFSHLRMENKKGEVKTIDKVGSNDIFNFFKEKKYINGKGKILDTLKLDLKNKKVEVPKRYEAISSSIVDIVKRKIGGTIIKPARQKREVKINHKVFSSPDFEKIWNKIKFKTTYEVEFDSDELIDKCSNALKEDLDIKPPKLIYTKAGINVKAEGVVVSEKGRLTVHSEEYEIALPDIVTFLQNETYLTRKTIVDVLIKSGTLEQFKKNPQEYMESSLKIISREMKHMLVDGIKYRKIEDDYYCQNLFKNEELYGYLSEDEKINNLIESDNSVYDYVRYDSNIEKEFAERLEDDENVLVYTKLPGWFKINTPIGKYNPDWAALLEDDGEEKMYFVVETKGNVDPETLRPTEKDKITCGKKHFEAIDKNINFEAVDSYETFKEKA
ncbi:type III restriction-modification system endonuclease [Methanobrevibacter curvatus]|uniref:Type III restriction enzyme, res subunit n=1 Tax=Methanobrevibacter curvatus TaxID=49547 RepID=A0A162FHS1_9EURY|nr:DEAD/DEAH box helicase family protein [Methanobrevibacter curvatus]KZX10150.1 type III restriction enzyme, res subunit [Methanobrevibacter curvatus]